MNGVLFAGTLTALLCANLSKQWLFASGDGCESWAEFIVEAMVPLGALLLTGLVSIVLCVWFATLTVPPSSFFTYCIRGLWYLVPALAANQGAGLARLYHLPLGAAPVSERWLGANKTWAAYYAGPLLAIIALYAQRAVVEALPQMSQLSPIDYAHANLLLIGGAVGLGATLFGDHLESFVKRRIGIPPGESFWPFDQTDFAFGGALAFFLTTAWIGIGPFFAFLLLMLLFHPIGNRIGLRIGTRDRL